MQQLSRSKAVWYHLYPGILITVLFTLVAPQFLKLQYPPQFSLLAIIFLFGLPVFYLHLFSVKRNENSNTIFKLNRFDKKIPGRQLFLYCAGLFTFAFLIWGVTEPLNKVLADKLLSWLPSWYSVQDFDGYSKSVVVQTLIFNLLLNGAIAPLMEELYFRGYLLPRMESWGRWAPVVNTILFSLYHLWQPQIWLTLLISLFPMCYLVWKTQDLRIGIYTHCLLNIVGALLSFGLLLK